MSTLERHIDELYALPLTAFTAARNALAKTLKGDDAARVKRLEKPSVVAWSVNQLYWIERRTFDALVAAGHHLRDAQINALHGKATDVRAATAKHRAALSEAVAAATRIAAANQVQPAQEPLSRMLESLSLAPTLPGPPGRFTEAVQPAGFEALAGITPVARPTPAPAHEQAGRHHAAGSSGSHAATQATRGGKATPAAAAARKQAEADAAARKAAEAAVATAQRALETATNAEARSREQLAVARERLALAEADHRRTLAAVDTAKRTLTDAESALKSTTVTSATRRR